MESNQIISRKGALWLGVCGILGSLVLFTGDMLYYYRGDETDLLANMSAVTDERIIISGVLALIAAWLYVAGSGQVFYAFQPEKASMRWLVFASFVMIMVAYGIIHGAYVAIATSAQIAGEMGLPPGDLTELAVAVNQALRYLVYLPFAVFTIGFTISVWRKRTYYPRWMLIFSPIVPFLLKGVIVGSLEGKMKVIIGDGYLNLILLLFFTSSTIALAFFENQGSDL
jgi:hypothetical protein